MENARATMQTRVIGFDEGEYRVRWELTEEELASVHRLRARTFCQELKWVGKPDDELEIDQHDRDAVHIAILHGEDGAVGTGRLLPPSSRWMFDATFGFLLPSPTASYKKPDTAEGSRLAVDRRFRAREAAEGFTFSDLVYKSVYTCCNLLGFRYVLIVVSTTVLRHLSSRGVPCLPAGPVVTMPDGVHAVAAQIDWGRLASHSAEEVKRWYGDVRYIHAPGHGRSPGTGSQRRAS
jgi:N-acyl-L-homoserine lactone synthetase